eukprot:jgi/Bigna1/81775/fgenesh1_pg.84_\
MGPIRKTMLTIYFLLIAVSEPLPLKVSRIRYSATTNTRSDYFESSIARFTPITVEPSNGVELREQVVIDDINAVVQPILDEFAQLYNTSFSFGFSNQIGSSSLVAGVDDIWSKVPITTHTRIPSGSTTKSWTAAAILQCCEKGLMSLEDRASKYVDPVLMRLNKSSMGSLWGSSVQDVTIDHLMSMTSGIQDYDDEAAAQFTIHHPNDDITPIDYIWSVNKTLICQVATTNRIIPNALNITPTSLPGSCAYYSSIGYMLLGLALVEVHGFESWEDFDQKAIIPENLQSRYVDTIFPKGGPCTKYDNISHQYLSYRAVYSKIYSYNLYSDMIQYSCLNGWTCGNIASTGQNLANYWWDLFTLQLVSNASMQAMQEFKPLENKWCPSCYYGKGLILSPAPWKMRDPSVDPREVLLIGHAGMDWASGTSPLCGLSDGAIPFGICLSHNSAKGMNCSLADVRDNDFAMRDVSCRVYDAVLGVLGLPRLNCSHDVYPKPHPIPICQWSYNIPSAIRGIN